MTVHPIADHHRPSTLPDRRIVTLSAIRTFIGRYVQLTTHQLDTLTIWTAHTWLIDAADTTPYMAVMSTEKRCGKTRLLEVIELLVRNPLRTADITEAALFRYIDRYPSVTVLLDEIDTVFGGGRSREPLRALLNASYRRGTPVHRVDGSYEVFGPKMIAGIGELPDTVADRSIPITMQRKDHTSTIERFYRGDVEVKADALRASISECFGPTMPNVDFARAVRSHRPDPLPFLNDRTNDSWEPLRSIAAVVGDDWPDAITDAAQVISGEGREYRELLTRAME